MVMENKVVSIREIQRNYRKLVDRVKETGQAVYLGVRQKPEAVLLGVGEFERLKQKANRGGKTWEEVEATLEQIRSSGKKSKTNLSDFIYADRHRH